MGISAHEPFGFEGLLVSVEVDIRRGIPCIDLVGLAEGAVREARERVRAAARNAGFEFPLDRILVNLSPAGLRKEGASYDLPIALAILVRAGSLPEPGREVLALGELRLDGSSSPVRGVLPAVAAALRAGIEDFVVPCANAAEARALGRGRVHSLGSLREALSIFAEIREGRSGQGADPPPPSPAAEPEALDFAELRGMGRVRRALEIAAAGGHHLLLFGPPGSGKTLAARCLPSILPDLGGAAALETSMLHSLASGLREGQGLMRRPPFRSPHHGSSFEGLLGGGRRPGPGELSLAHNGVLFLDEATEFRRDVLQSLREPLEERSVALARAGRSLRFPASFMLVLAANPCACGNLGRRDRSCLCSQEEIGAHWRRLGAPLLDRIDLRVPVRPQDELDLLGPRGEGSASIKARVGAARERQARRRGEGSLNASMGPAEIAADCSLTPDVEALLLTASSRLSLSARACHSVLKVARTIADLQGRERIGEEALLEAVQHRRYGDGEFYWEESGISPLAR